MKLGFVFGDSLLWLCVYITVRSVWTAVVTCRLEVTTKQWRHNILTNQMQDYCFGTWGSWGITTEEFNCFKAKHWLCLANIIELRDQRRKQQHGIYFLHKLTNYTALFLVLCFVKVFVLKCLGPFSRHSKMNWNTEGRSWGKSREHLLWSSRENDIRVKW